MSECNYCTLQRYKRDAKKRGAKLILKASNFMEGTDVFEIPAKEFKLPDYKEPSESLPNGDEVYQKYHKSWMMEISNHCVC